MKTKYIFASLLVSSLAVTGCQDMDTLPDGGIVTDSQKETVSTLNPERGVAKVNAIFSTFNQASRRNVVEDIGCLVHFDHERRFSY